jgi:localization factor PodJL
MIESGIHPDAPARAAHAGQSQKEAVDSVPDEPAHPLEQMPVQAAAAVAPTLKFTGSAPRRAVAPRPPLDPNLPPDHPLEPGSAPGTSRIVPSAADRIAASEAAFGSAKPFATPPPEAKPNFIAAARRAARAAASAPSEQKPSGGVTAVRERAPGTLSQRLRKLLVAGAVVLIAVGGLRIATHMFEDRGSDASPQPQLEQAAPPIVPPETDSTKQPAPEAVPAAPLPLPAPPATTPSGSLNTTPDAPAAAKPGVPTDTIPARQSALHGRTGQPVIADSATANGMPLWTAPDITGSVTRPAAPQSAAPAPTPANAGIDEKLPATIGGPALRAAAMAGDASAAFEVATRFAEGRGVPQSNEIAAHWLDRAAKQGLAPAQFRLGSFYEKGVGVKKDLAAARDLYLAAADKGNGKAMHNLAVLYAEGINGPPDYRTAAHWFRKAADHGITDSQYNLAILYARGTGVEQNYAESYKWFVLVANTGDSEAAKKRDEVASHLDKQSLAAARLAAQTWSAEPQPEDATDVKGPPGGWDASANGAPAAKAKPRPSSAKAPVPDTKLD